MRIGIHTGPVILGSLGNDLRVEFKAVGDTVNIASRLEKLAESASTCVSESTFKLTEGYFQFEALGKKQIKGIEKPSMEIIQYLFKYIPGSRLFLILTYRPDFTFTWETKSYYSQITLSQHPKAEIIRILNYLLRDGIVDPYLEQLIVDKTEGNPPFKTIRFALLA